MRDPFEDEVDEVDDEVGGETPQTPGGTAPGGSPEGGVTVMTPGDPVANALTQVPIDESKKAEVVSWLYDEIARAKSDRNEVDMAIAEYNRLYEAKPKEAVKNFPWPNASNIVVPVVATAVDSVVARLMGAIFGAKDIWAPTAKSPKWHDVVAPLGVWLNWVARNVLGMYKVLQKWILGATKHGTGIVKITWERRFKRVTFMEGGSVTEEIVVDHDGPVATVVPLTDFYLSADGVTTGNVQQCAWVAHRKYFTWKELKGLEASGIFHDVDDIKDYRRSYPEDVEAQTQEATGVTVSEYTDYEIWEVWCSYDLDGDGIASELVVTFEPQSRHVLSAVYNYYRHQERPFHVLPYMPREDSILGIGIPEMLADVQTEVTTIHNQRIDNATLANTRSFKRRRSSVVGADEIYPGSFLDVDEMDDITELKIGDTYPSMLSEELNTNAIGEKRTGVSDYTVGRESAAIGSRATATSTMALIKEGNKRFQMTIAEMRERLSDIAHQVIMLYQQFAPDNTVMYEMFSEKEGMIMKEFLTLPIEYSKANVAVRTPALSEVDNKEMKQQTMLTLMGITQGFYTSMFEVLGIAMSPEAPPPVKELAKHAATMGSKLYERILEAFDFRDADSFAPDMEELLAMASFMEQMQQGMGGAGADGQGLGGPQGAPGGIGQMGAGAGGGMPAQGSGAGQAQGGQNNIGNLL